MPAIASKAKRRILSVTIRRAVDEDPDFSFLGEYQSSPGPDDRTIDREERGDRGSREYRYFVAAMSGKETGNPASVEHDYQRCESYTAQQWCFVGVWAECSVVNGEPGSIVQKIRSGGLWGIESDSGNDCFAEVAGEQLAELRDELLSIGFSARQIKTAFAMAKNEND